MKNVRTMVYQKWLITAMLLIASFLFAAGPLTTRRAYAAGNGVYAKLTSLKSKYPEGYFWNHQVTTSTNDGDSLMARRDESFANSVTRTPCATHNGKARIGQYDCNYFDGGMQCMGFAKKVFYDIFGQRESQLGRRYDTANLMVGDYVRINNNGHSGVVLSISGSTFRLCECNFDKEGAHHNCLIRWGYVTYNKSCITYFKHATNYSTVDAGSIKMDWNNVRANIGNTNATVYVTAQANVSGSFTAASATVYDQNGRYYASKSETARTNGSYMNVWYNIQSEMGRKLSPGTKYYIQFKVTFSGKSYTSPLYNFRTTGTNPSANVAVTKIALSRSYAYLLRGRTLTLKATIAPTNATNKNVTWKSSNTKVATVSAKGVVKAVKRGTCTITATSANGKKASCRIVVW